MSCLFWYGLHELVGVYEVHNQTNDLPFTNVYSHMVQTENAWIQSIPIGLPNKVKDAILVSRILFQGLAIIHSRYLFLTPELH